jgi:hypothetical protein
MVSWFGPQNQVSFSLLVAAQNQPREVGAGYTSSTSVLLCREASLARVFQSDLKTGRCAMTGGACGTIMEVVSDVS